MSRTYCCDRCRDCRKNEVQAPSCSMQEQSTRTQPSSCLLQEHAGRHASRQPSRYATGRAMHRSCSNRLRSCRSCQSSRPQGPYSLRPNSPRKASCWRRRRSCSRTRRFPYQRRRKAACRPGRNNPGSCGLKRHRPTCHQAYASRCFRIRTFSWPESVSWRLPCTSRRQTGSMPSPRLLRHRYRHPERHRCPHPTIPKDYRFSKS